MKGVLDGNPLAGAEAETLQPNSNNVIVVRISPGSNNTKDLTLAGIILHEGMHAQLYRIIASNNNVKYNINNADYQWLLQLNEWWKNQSKIFPEINAQHDFMSVKYVHPIAKAIRSFDSNNYSLNNYMYFGWDGLFDEGKNRGLITKEEFSYYSILKEIPLNDNHKISCE